MEVIVFIAGIAMLCLFQTPLINPTDMSISYKSIFSKGDIDLPLFLLYFIAWCFICTVQYFIPKSRQLPE